MDKAYSQPERRIYTVSEITQSIKGVLEDAYPFVWIAGEISNLRIPVSGHFYFTLKDPGAQISAVMFRGQTRNLKFRPEDGMAVIAMGRLNVYEPRGAYQVIVEYLEPEGIGILQLAFEQLKTRLTTEGLFDQEHKRQLPFLPQKVAMVTSPTGAVIRDMMNVINRRFPNIVVVVAPVKVQGAGAADEIVRAVEMLNELDDADVIVLARGGGSLEDLQAFNSEIVARVIFSSHIPVVSAVGHETDFTISDFVADLRAPTPSVAAELIVPVKEDLLRRVAEKKDALKVTIVQRIRFLREQTVQLSRRFVRLIHQGKQLTDYRLRIDDAFGRILRGLSRQLTENKNQTSIMHERLCRCSPQITLHSLNMLLEHHHQTLVSAMHFVSVSKKTSFRTAVAKLNALNPLEVLERGYSMTRTLPDYAVVKDVLHVNVGQHVEVTLSRGAMVCRIERKISDGQANI